MDDLISRQEAEFALIQQAKNIQGLCDKARDVAMDWAVNVIHSMPEADKGEADEDNRSE